MFLFKRKMPFRKTWPEALADRPKTFFSKTEKYVKESKFQKQSFFFKKFLWTHKFQF